MYFNFLSYRRSNNIGIHQYLERAFLTGETLLLHFKHYDSILPSLCPLSQNAQPHIYLSILKPSDAHRWPLNKKQQRYILLPLYLEWVFCGFDHRSGQKVTSPASRGKPRFSANASLVMSACLLLRRENNGGFKTVHLALGLLRICTSLTIPRLSRLA